MSSASAISWIVFCESSRTMAFTPTINFLLHFLLFFILPITSCRPEFSPEKWLNRIKTVLADGADDRLAACRSAYIWICDLPRSTHTLVYERKSITENVSFDAIVTGRVTLPKTGQWCNRSGKNQTSSIYQKICAKCWKRCLKSGFVQLTKKHKISRYPKKLVLGGVMLYYYQWSHVQRGTSNWHNILRNNRQCDTLFEWNVKIWQN